MNSNYTHISRKEKFAISINAIAFILFFILYTAHTSNAQTTYTFTNCSATGMTGPTQAQVNAAYLLTNLNGSVIATGGIQSFTLPTSGNYQITAAGAGGGNANAFGGRGRIVRGEVNLAAGTVLRILVGQKGILTTSSGGGGGSYVSNTAGNATIIVGGGGAGFVGGLGAAVPSSDGNIGTAGNNANDGALGGTNGAGGNGASGGWGGGGGGYNTNGTDASACLNTRGIAFLNGGTGGNTCNNTQGGFGGGGGTHGNTGGGGGGGGFSGGGGSTQNLGNSVGGGGGSYLSGLTNTVDLGYNLGQGYVILTQMCVPGACVGTPTPGVSQASPTTGCVSYTTALSITGNVIPCSGLAYQWQAGPSIAGPWTAIPNATLLTAVGSCSTASTFFRCLMTCGASTAASTPVNCVIPACAGTPTPGSAVANPTAGCGTFNSTITLVGNVVQCGLSYQWQSGPALAGPYTNIGGATNLSVAVSGTVVTFYRCVVSCGGNTIASTPVSVSVTPGPCATGVWYINSNSGDPWGSTSNQTSMNAAFSNTWTQGYYQTINTAAVFNQTTCLVFMEGGDANANDMNTYITANIAAMQNWVNAGGRLLLNAAPNQGGNMNWGFGGVLLNYATGPYSGSAYAAPGQSAHPIFNGPILPAGTGTYTGNWWCHGYVNGGGMTNLIVGTTPGASLGELAWGAGRVMAGSMTTPNWHLPVPNSQNLMTNILAYLSCTTQILPIELTKFNIHYNGENCEVNWETSSERNTDYYTVEKSYDGKEYVLMEKIVAAGNSNNSKKYSSIDINPNKNGVTYYRLKQYDIGNNKPQYNETRILSLNEKNPVTLKLSPNPASTYLGVYLPEAFSNNNIILQVFDNTGRKQLSLQLDRSVSKPIYNLNIESLNSGMYSIQLSDESGNTLKKSFIKN